MPWIHQLKLIADYGQTMRASRSHYIDNNIEKLEMTYLFNALRNFTMYNWAMNVVSQNTYKYKERLGL